MILVDSISECIARCVSEMLTLLLGCSQASFYSLLTAILGAQGWVLLLPVPSAMCGVCWGSPSSWVQLGLHPPCSTHGFLSWMALAAWLLSGPHFYLVSWLACPGKLPSPALLVKLSGWPAFPFPSLFSPSHTWCLLAPTVYLSLSLGLPLMS